MQRSSRYIGFFLAVVLFKPMTFAQTAASVDQKISALLARMTLEEKLGQMSQSTSMKTPLSEELKNEIRHGRWGSFLNAAGPEERAEAQRIALSESRLGIPLLFGRDVIHGYRTIFPIPLGQSASWDPELIRQAARVAAQEATTEGIRWAFSPMLDVARDPRWGRVAEGFGEDPYLTSVLGAAMIHGYQSDSLSSADAMAACAKHFAGYGAVEAGREYNSAWIPENQLRDVYLPPFHVAVEAGAATFMTGFQAVNGVPATGNRYLLENILRDEWKFRGFVVSDYTAIPELIQHGFVRDDADAAAKALDAGVDMEMVSTTYFDHLKNAVENGRVDMRRIDAAVRKILRLKFELGLFNKDAAQLARHVNLDPASLATAKRLAIESTVLLKNKVLENGSTALPLDAGVRTVAVIGPLADAAADQMGSWAMDGRADDVQTPLAALRAKLGGDRVLYASGLKNSRDTDTAGFADALAKAKASDVVLLFLGEEQILSGEARSRAFLDLPGAQDALVSEVAKAGKPMIAIIMTGRPLTFHAVAEKAGAVLYAWHPGTMGGPAIVDLLFGDATPSGKLTMTFPRTVGQVPIYYAHLNTGRPPSNADLGILLGNPVNPVGYVSKYIDVDFTPEYVFGFGLSYTEFEYSNLKLSREVIDKNTPLNVRATITNRGHRAGDEIVQLYIHQRTASVAQPVRELKGFQRIHLAPGEHTAVTFPVAANDLAFHDTHGRLVTEAGEFDIWIAPDSHRGLQAEFQLK